MTGVDSCETCPGYYLRLPAVLRACEARRWAERGQLTVVEPHPSNALIEAINVLDDAVCDRTRREYERTERELRERGKGGGDVGGSGLPPFGGPG